MNKPIQLICALGIGTLFFLSPVAVHAEDADKRIAELEEQVAALQEQVEALRKRVAALEPIPTLKPGPGESAVPASAGDWSIRANWMALRKGMTKKQVVELLGEPETVRSMPYGHNWFYPSGYTTFDHMGRLTRWSTPL
jgi:type II secretory pathway component PulM